MTSRRVLPLAVAISLLAAALAVPAVAHHGGREITSLFACDRPVEPPRCTSVGDDFLHYVHIDASVPEALAGSLRDTMAEDYGTTRLHVIEHAEVTPLTDVIAFAGDFGENGAAGWVYCPSDAPQGVNDRGDRWCRQQEMFFNLNPRYGLFFDDDASRDHVTCHEMGHTIGLRHWGNPPETEGEVGATCMNGNTPNGPTGLHPFDIDHINAYPYRSWPTPPGVEVVRAPAGPIHATGAYEPRSVAELVEAGDAVVRGRVVAVEPGRQFGPSQRPLHYASVTVDVADVLAGELPARHASRLVLEVPLYDGADAVDGLEADLLGTERVLFVSNKGESARAAGMSADAIAADADFYRLTSAESELVVVDGRLRVAGVLPSPLDALHERTPADLAVALETLEP